MTLSPWGMMANRILMELAYFDERRGFTPLRDLLSPLLSRKWEYVNMAEVAEAEGQPWTPQEFSDLCFDGFEKILGVSRSSQEAGGSET